MDLVPLAWAAGIFEGEGWIGSSRQSRGSGWSISAHINMTDRDVLDRFCDVVGMGKVTTYPPKNGYKPVSRWGVCSFEEVQYLVCLIWEWLGERRRSQIFTALLQIAADGPPRQRRPHRVISRTRTPSQQWVEV
jgi:hypothetical protein